MGKFTPQLTTRYDKISIRSLLGLSLALMLIGFAFDSPGNLLRGLGNILTSPSNLLSDYFAIGGIGATFLNSGLTTLLSVLMVWRMKLKITGAITAAIITVLGFSFFGKNVVNSIPVMMGCFLYARYREISNQSVILAMLFGTTLAPVVSFIAFGTSFPLWIGIIVGSLVGMIVGFALPPVASHFLMFHQGFNLYNYGFTAGVIAMALVAVLRLFNVKVVFSQQLYLGEDLPVMLLLIAFCVLLLVVGFIRNGSSFQGYDRLLKESGRIASDFILQHDAPLVLINMGLCGLISIAYVIISQGVFNGPVLGGFFTIIGFAAFGKHPRNIIPVLAGILIANHFGVHQISSTGAILSGLFGTCLAPIAGYYGWAFGLIAGVFHAAMVNNVGFLHGGLNLYNNGFSGGFVAAVLAPIFDLLTHRLPNDPK